ncbi:hypothetical protein QZH41_001291 [Actinostola sp. cb2023]|nr:hypothetical protein QZH41_001291 [Actinostola sp. cb2023]
MAARNSSEFTLELRSRNTEVGTQKSELRSRKLRSRNSEVGTQKSELRSRNSEVGTQKSELRSRNSEVGTQKSELRSRNSEVGTRNSEVETQKSKLRSRNSEVGTQKSEVGTRKWPYEGDIRVACCLYCLEMVYGTWFEQIMEHNGVSYFLFKFRGYQQCDPYYQSKSTDDPGSDCSSSSEDYSSSEEEEEENEISSFIKNELLQRQEIGDILKEADEHPISTVSTRYDQLHSMLHHHQLPVPHQPPLSSTSSPSSIAQHEILLSLHAISSKLEEYEHEKWFHKTRWKALNVEFFQGNLALFTRHSIQCVVKDEKIFKLDIVTPSIREGAVKNEEISNWNPVNADAIGARRSVRINRVSI